MTLWGTTNPRIQNERREAAVARNVRKLEVATQDLAVSADERRTLLWIAESASGCVDHIAALLQRARKGGGA